MKRLGKIGLAISTFAILVFALNINSFAASKKINSVSVKIEGNIEVDTKMGQENLDISTGSGNYYFDYYTVENTGFRWTLDDVPELVIYLQADDNYYFNITKASQITVNGGTYVKATRQSSSTILMLTVKLPSLATQVYPIDQATMSVDGILTWSESLGAGSYEVKFSRGNTILGGIQTTQSNTLDVSKYMTKEGNYSFKVRPINAKDKSVAGFWVESNTVFVPESQAAYFRQLNNERDSAGTWKADETGRWFVLPDGTYPTSQWRQIHGEWYYFKADGYAATSWYEVNGKWYYFDLETAKMWKNTKTPDGYMLGIDGARANQ